MFSIYSTQEMTFDFLLLVSELDHRGWMDEMVGKYTIKELKRFCYLLEATVMGAF